MNIEVSENRETADAKTFSQVCDMVITSNELDDLSISMYVDESTDLSSLKEDLECMEEVMEAQDKTLELSVILEGTISDEYMQMIESTGANIIEMDKKESIEISVDKLKYDDEENDKEIEIEDDMIDMFGDELVDNRDVYEEKTFNDEVVKEKVIEMGSVSVEGILKGEYSKGKKEVDDAKIISISASSGGVSKTTIACNIAMVMSKNKIRTCLVDADFLSPNVHVNFNIPEESHVIYYSGGIEKSEVDKAIKKVDKFLFVLPAPINRNKPTPGEHDMSELTKILSKSFDVVIFDTPQRPLSIATATEILRESDIIYWVLTQSTSSVDEIVNIIPKLVMVLGAEQASKLRVIMSKYNDKLIDVRIIEDAVKESVGRIVGRRFKISACIPENWVGYNKAVGNSKVMDEHIFVEIAQEIVMNTGLGKTVELVKPKESLFDKLKTMIGR